MPAASDRHTATTLRAQAPSRPAPLLLNWRNAKVSDPMQPCVLCGSPAILRDPATDEPKHKVCAEDALAERGA